MCRGRRRSYATSPGKLSSCNRRDHRRGLTLTCSRLKTATSCLQRAEVTSLQTRETNSKIRTVCFPSKAWCGRLDVGWWKQNGMAGRCPAFQLCFSASERKEPPALGLCPGAVLSASLRSASLQTAPELVCVPFTFRVQRLPATFVVGSKPHSALPFEGEACRMILNPGFQYIKRA